MAPQLNRSRAHSDTKKVVSKHSFSTTGYTHRGSSRGHEMSIQNNSKRCTCDGIWLGRALFLITLAIVAAVLGGTTYNAVAESERSLAESQFASIATRSAFLAAEIVNRKRLGTVSMSSVVAHVFPDEATWPLVALDGYEAISNNLIATSSGRGQALAVKVTPSERASFEDFVYTYYNSTRWPDPFPQNTGGDKGIWEFGKDGSPSAFNASETAFPYTQHNSGNADFLLLDARFNDINAKAIQDLVRCTDDRAAQQDLSKDCFLVTKTFVLVAATGSPGTLMMQPIYPANDPFALTGILVSSVLWNETLDRIFDSRISGIDCVLQSDTQEEVVYSIHNGVPELKESNGVSACKRSRIFHESAVLTNVALGYSPESPEYLLTFCATEDFFTIYSTNNPRTAAITAVFCVLGTAVLFLVYDFFVRREFVAKSLLLDSKRKFMRYVGHEVRTPLNSMAMGLSLLQAEVSACVESGERIDPSTGVGWSELIQDLIANTEAAVGVMNDLLHYDKIETGNLQLELSNVPIWELIQKVAAEFNLQAHSQGIHYTVEMTDTSVDSETISLNADCLPPRVLELKVVGDPARLAQCIRNLVSNALKFTPEGGSVAISVRLQRETNIAQERLAKTIDFELHDGEKLTCFPSFKLVEILVSDTGAGLSENQLEQLFRSGVQFNVNKLQAGQGSGLGLYISQGIVEQHGGTLSAMSKGLGQGSTFRLVLPLYQIPDSGVRAPSKLKCESVGIPLESTKQSVLRILVVDDSKMNRKLLVRILEKQGHHCDQAENGREAVQNVQTAKIPYDTILMDYEMPVMNGADSTKEIRALGHDTFIVGLSGNVLPEDVAHFKSCGVNSVLPKPFCFPDLDVLWTEHGIDGTGPPPTQQATQIVVDRGPRMQLGDVWFDDECTL